MSLRQVYFDFQDGAGFINVSDFVKYESLKINIVGFNDNYRSAQNTCSLSLIYDATIYNKLRTMSDDILVRIVDLRDNAKLLTEDDWFIVTEDSFYICAESDIAVPIFYGHIPVTRSVKYNGILDNIIYSLEAVDDLDWMDIPVGDILYSNCAVYDPADPANSIVHKLGLIAGWTSVMYNQDISIPTVISRFAPNSEDDTVRDVLDRLLHEYGYVLNLDEQGYIYPIQWDADTGITPFFEFNEQNIALEITTTDKTRNYDAVEIKHYELNLAEKIRIFTDSNCGFTDNGQFQGYVVPNNYYYPLEANVIDEATSTNQIVHQEYIDEAIKYWTNKAIKENLDFNYEVFDSDFSGIIATENHFLDNRIESGLTHVSSTFGNKKARILYQNTSGASKRIYFNNIYADVWYTSAERIIKIDIVTDPSKIAKITLQFVYDGDIARAYAKAIAKQYEIASLQYSFQSANDRPVGDIVDLVTSHGIDQMCIVQSREWDEYSELFSYKLVPISAARGNITQQDVSQTIYVSPPSPFTSSTSTGQINIPYVGTTPDFTNAWVEMNVQQNGVDVTEDWAFTATPTNCTGEFDATITNRYKITAISATNASVILKANRTGWQEQSQLVTVIKAIGETGDTGTAGTNTAILYLYQRKSTVPAVTDIADPVTYTFATEAITGSIGAWSRTPPTGTDPLYVIAATASSNTATDTIARSEWSTPVILAQNGEDGSAGLNSATVFLYKRGTSAPTRPTTTSTYTFSTGVLTGHDNGWIQTIPTGTDPCYITQATAVGTGTTDTIASTEWSYPIILVQNGEPGTGITLKGSVLDYTYLPTTGVSVGDLYIIETAGGGYDAGDGAVASAISPIVWENVGQIQGPQGEPGEQGIAGVSARGVSLSSTTLAFTYNASGSSPQPSGTVVTATRYNSSGTGYYRFLVNGTQVQAWGTTSTYTYTPQASHTNMPQIVAVQYSEVADGSVVLATDEITMIGVLPGQSALTPLITNASHTCPAEADGTNAIMTGSGTSIQIYEGATLLTFHTTPGNGRFTIASPVVSPTGKLLVGAPSGSGTTTAVIADHSSFASDTDIVTITYPISVTRLDGATASLSLVQTITKSKEGVDGLTARYVVLAPSAGGVTFNTAGTTPSPTNIDLTATAYNTSGTLYYEFFDNGVSLGVSSTSATKNLSFTGKTFANFPRRLSVEVREGSSTNPVVATDYVSIVGLQAGASGISPIVSNESHVLPSNVTGTVSSYTESGTTIRIFEGATALTYRTTIANSSFIIGTPTVFPVGAITVGAPSGSGTTTAVIADHSGASASYDVITITYPITVRRADGTDIAFNIEQTLTKGKQGFDGARYLGIGVPTSSTDNNISLFTVSTSEPYAFVSGGTAVALEGDTVFVRHFSGETDDNRKALFKWTGSAWTNTTITNADRSQASIDLLTTCKIYGTPTTGDAYVWLNSIVVNQAFIDFLSVNSVEFTNYVASIAGDLVPRSGSDLGTLQAFMGKQPRNVLDDDGLYKFALQEYVGMSGSSEVWMQHFWTKLFAGGAIGLLLAGSLQSCQQVYSNPGQMWAKQSSPFGTSPIYAVTYGNGKYVAGGTGGKLAYSTDAITWTLATSPFGTSTVWAVVYGNGVYLAGDGSGKLAYSTDAITWTLATSPFGGAVTALSYGNGKYVAGDGSGKLAYSTDAITWTLATSPFGTSGIWAMDYGIGKFVAGGDTGKMAYSLDAITWTLIASPFGTSDVREIVYGNGRYVAGGDDGKISYSTDAITWVPATSPFGTISIAVMTYGNGKYVLGTDGGEIAYSFDAITWASNNVSQPFGRGVYLGACCSEDQNKFVLVGYLYGGSEGVIITSDPMEAGCGIIQKGESTDGLSSYTLFSDGTLICRGDNTGVSGSYRTIIFPYAFKNASYSAVCTTTTSSSPECKVINRYTASMRVESYLNGTKYDTPFSWIAIGEASI